MRVGSWPGRSGHVFKYVPVVYVCTCRCNIPQWFMVTYCLLQYNYHGDLRVPCASDILTM